MRSLRKLLEDGNPSPEEKIEIRNWVRLHPESDMAGRLEERFPHLVPDGRPVGNASS